MPLYPVELSAGQGRVIWPSGEPLGHYSVTLQSVRAAHLSIPALAGFHIRGNSMEPDIHDGDIVIIDTPRTMVPPGARRTFAIRVDDELSLKHLSWDGMDLIISSTNRSSTNKAGYPPVRLAPVDAERVQVIGRFWVAFRSQPVAMQP